jgi:hypothetical protein
MVFFKYFLLALLVIQFACAPTTIKIVKNPNVAISVDLEKDDKVSVNDIFSDIEIIPLETNKESVFNSLFDKFFVMNDKYYYILDSRNESIFVFEQNGIFVKRINKKGQGPGEYTAIEDFNINRFTNNLEIISPWGYLLIYDYLGDIHIETIKVGEIIHNTSNLTNDIDVCFTGSREKNKMFFFSRREKKIIGECFSRPDFIYMKTAFHHTASPFFIYNDSIFFYDTANGDIFTIDPNDRQLKPRYQWDFGMHNFDISLLPDDKDNNYYMKFLNYGNDEYAFSFLMNVENNNYFVARFRFKKIHRTIIYNKKTKKYLLFHEFNEGFQCMPNFMTDEYLYSIISPDYLPMIINENGLNEENRNKLKQIQEDDNCVVVRYKLKNND